MVRFRFYGAARQLAGAGEAEVEVQAPAPLRELLAGLFPGREIVPSKWLESVLVNGRNCIFLDGLETLVGDGDRVDILPTVLGG